MYNVAKSRLKYISFAAHWRLDPGNRVNDGSIDVVANAYNIVAVTGWKYYNYTPICPI